MSLYPLLETGIILMIGIFSIYQVMNTLMPRFTHRVRASIALRLSHARGGHWRNVATRVHGAAPASGCGAGCGSGCNGCGIAARIRPRLSGDDKASH